MNIAIIPARIGSKRIPKKNIKIFFGKPIIYWTIKKVIESKLFDRVIVSTDSDQIKKLAIKYNVEVPFIRPKKLANDHADTISVISHAIRKIYKTSDKINFVCCIYPTSPFLNIKDLYRGYKKIRSSKFDFVFSACQADFNVLRTFNLKKNDKIKMIFPNKYKTRSQDAERAYYDAAQFYWGTKDAWLNEISIFNENASFIEIDKNFFCDIDEIKDWKRAKTLYKKINKLKY